MFEAFELALRMDVFALTDARTVRIIQKAIAPFDATLENDRMIKSISKEDRRDRARE